MVTDAEGLVDMAATEALRTEMRAARSGSKLFDYGPSIEQLRANCEIETGLPAPIQPVWRQSPLAEAAE